MQRVHFQVWVVVFSCQDKYLFPKLWHCGKKQIECGLAWSVLLSTTIPVITVVKILWTCEVQPSKSVTNWATSQSEHFALVSEYVSSIHPWTNSRCRISQSERALCFSYVLKRFDALSVSALTLIVSLNTRCTLAKLILGIPCDRLASPPGGVGNNNIPSYFTSRNLKVSADIMGSWAQTGCMIINS